MSKKTKLKRKDLSELITEFTDIHDNPIFETSFISRNTQIFAFGRPIDDTKTISISNSTTSVNISTLHNSANQEITPELLEKGLIELKVKDPKLVNIIEFYSNNITDIHPILAEKRYIRIDEFFDVNYYMYMYSNSMAREFFKYLSEKVK